MISGGNEGWFGLEVGDETGDGDVAGEDVSNVGDNTSVILSAPFSCLGSSSGIRIKYQMLLSIRPKMLSACQQASVRTPGWRKSSW